MDSTYLHGTAPLEQDRLSQLTRAMARVAGTRAGAALWYAIFWAEGVRR